MAETRKRPKPGTWEWLLAQCLRHGKERVIGRLERQLKQTRWAVAANSEHPEARRLAETLEAMAERQEQTLARLRALTEDDMRRAMGE